jgi:hypothetical protein
LEPRQPLDQHAGKRVEFIWNHANLRTNKQVRGWGARELLSFLPGNRSAYSVLY